MAGGKDLVTKVLDGDTFETASRKNPIRLANVDAPERGTPGGAAATEDPHNKVEGGISCVTRTVAVLALLATTGAACATSPPTSDIPSPVACSSLTFLTGGVGNELQQVSFRSGSLRIGALLTKPEGTGPFPAYIHNHGAMTIQKASGPLWSVADRLDLELVRAGYVVLRPARRGYLGSEGRTTTY